MHRGGGPTRTLCQMVGQLRGTIFQRVPCDPAKQPCVTLGWDVSTTTQAHTTSFRHLSECRLGLRRWGDAMIAGAASPFAIFFTTHQDSSHTSQPTCTIECGHGWTAHTWHHGSSARSRSSHSDCAASSVGTGRSTSGGGGGISVGGGSGGGDGGDNTDPVPPPLKLDGVEKARARAGAIGGVRDSIQSSCTPDAGDRGGCTHMHRQTATRATDRYRAGAVSIPPRGDSTSQQALDKPGYAV